MGKIVYVVTILYVGDDAIYNRHSNSDDAQVLGIYSTKKEAIERITEEFQVFDELPEDAQRRLEEEGIYYGPECDSRYVIHRVLF